MDLNITDNALFINNTGPSDAGIYQCVVETTGSVFINIVAHTYVSVEGKFPVISAIPHGYE